tara:strand:- start:795 stop:1058 length:264 start_codon:yes stop_codon:yes gene_type:complete
MDLTKLEKSRLALFDNRASELATWDTEVLATLTGIDNLFDNIFSDKELAVLLGDDYEADLEEKCDISGSSGEAIVVCPNCQHEFKPT